MRTPERIVGCCCVVLLVAAGVLAAESSDETTPYHLVEVSPSVVTAQHENGSNITCVVFDDELVFFDASLSTRTARFFRKDMETRFDRPTGALVLTHAHLDHILGMAAFDDVPVYAAAAGRPRWEHLLAVEWDEKAIAGYGAIFKTLPDEVPDARMRLPSEWFDDELVLGSGDGELVVRRTGGHTIDSSSALVGVDRVVVAGDLVQARRRPYFGEPDTDFEAWIDTLKGWEAREVKAICPGHGPVIDGAELGEMRRWYEAISAAVADLKKAGLSVEEVFLSDDLPVGYWPAEDSVPRWWGFCVKRLYDAS